MAKLDKRKGKRLKPPKNAWDLSGKSWVDPSKNCKLCERAQSRTSHMHSIQDEKKVWVTPKNQKHESLTKNRYLAYPGYAGTFWYDKEEGHSYSDWIDGYRTDKPTGGFKVRVMKEEVALSRGRSEGGYVGSKRQIIRKLNGIEKEKKKMTRERLSVRKKIEKGVTKDHKEEAIEATKRTNRMKKDMRKENKEIRAQLKKDIAHIEAAKKKVRGLKLM
tara:strand:- start:485 stop:1138 length:654 start_codon:yes stop_codon:yes gene_type:complete